MTQSEVAFLAFGLMLGAAGGAALVVALGTRLPGREVRVTVTRDAVPRRSPTLAIDAFVTQPAEPARGGPGDRRSVERRPSDDRSPSAGIPVGPGHGPSFARAAAGVPDRTVVRSETLESVTAVQTLVARAEPATGPAILRILRGDHGAMLEVVDALAGLDGVRRREWEVLLAGLGEAIAETAVDEGILDFPLGIPFWDAFTVEQCRQITASLASMGYRFDGHDGWVDDRAPGYRELSQALADVGIDPVRIRIWPNASEIAQLFRGARPASDDLVARDASDLRLEAVRDLTRWHADSLTGLWATWAEVRPLLLAELPPE